MRFVPILPSKKHCVTLRKLGPLVWKIVLREYGRYRTYRNARAAVNAFDGIDVQQLFGFVPGVVLLRMDTIYRARVHASRIFRSDARFGDNVCHAFNLTQGLRSPNRLKVSRD